jgi:hypothetical protein
LTIEGRLLDLTVNELSLPFGSFFDLIRIQIDKKYHTPVTVTSPNPNPTPTPILSGGKVGGDPNFIVYEWRKEQFVSGKKASCFRFKIYSDKLVMPVKIFLIRSNDSPCKRYELNSALKELLPHMRADPTEDEALTAVWQYIEFNSIYDFTTSRPLLKCDEVRFVISVNLPLLSLSLSVLSLSLSSLSLPLSLSPSPAETSSCSWWCRPRLSLDNQIQSS